MRKTALIISTPRRRLFAAACAIFLCSALGTGTAAAQAPAIDPAAALRVDSTARLLAGLPPSSADHAALADTATWKSHSIAMEKSWSRPRDGQLAAMKQWRATELPQQCPVGSTLFYPFSGPDFLNAWTLFPECDTFVMFGLEPVGRLPDPSAMKPKEFASLLSDVRDAMINLFARNYFITSRMQLQLRTERLRGVLPVITMSMVLAGLEVTGTGPAPFPNTKGAKHNLSGVTIDFRVPGSPRPRRVIYYSLDISDKGLADYPAFIDYLRGMAPTTTLVKSASYLMHITEFRKIRNLVLEISEFLVQDDTGVPYAPLRKAGWEVRPYGVYLVPIPPFEAQYQKSLAALYDSANPQPLPFRFGYHTKPSDTRSTLMVARRPPAAAPPKPDAR